MRKRFVLLFAFCIGSIAVHAAVTLPKIFADNMVLQRNVLIPVWGWADANEKVTAKFNKQTVTVKADKAGKWMVRLAAEAAGGPYELLIQGKNIVEIKNVLVGEVWLCSGQSNMEWTVTLSDNAKTEIAAANNPFIRHIKIEHAISTLPQQDVVTNQWQQCDSLTVGNFTAIGYFFARNLYDSLKIPIGIINDTWGGTNVETWISRDGFESSDEFKEMIKGMPKIGIDSLSKIMVGANLQRVEALQGNKLSASNSYSFKESSFDDSKWPEIYQPMVWENHVVGRF